jgi:hypothetical protein
MKSHALCLSRFIFHSMPQAHSEHFLDPNRTSASEKRQNRPRISASTISCSSNSAESPGRTGTRAFAGARDECGPSCTLSPRVLPLFRDRGLRRGAPQRPGRYCKKLRLCQLNDESSSVSWNFDDDDVRPPARTLAKLVVDEMKMWSEEVE